MKRHSDVCYQFVAVHFLFAMFFRGGSMRHIGRLLVVAFTIALVTGCAYNDVFVRTPDIGQFAGLTEGLRDSKRLNLIVIHGMGTHPVGYSHDWLQRIGNRLSLSQDTVFPGKTIRIVRNQDRTLSGYLRVSQFTSRLRDPISKERLLRVYEVTWSPATQVLKDKAFAYDDNYAVSRSAFNREMKKKLMNDSFGDAVQYVGKKELREAMQFPIEQALCFLTNDSALDNVSNGAEADNCEFAPVLDPDFGFAVLTHSLGSAILFDVISGLTDDHVTSLGGFGSSTAIQKENAQNAIKRFESGIYHIFMMANQLPLIHLAANEVCDIGKAPHRSIAPIIKFLERLGSYLAPLANRMRTIVAFNDPNDLLSYPISECLRDSVAKFNFVDIEISIAKWALYIPGNGMASNPLDAHVNYPENDRLIELIACGSSSDRCPPLVGTPMVRKPFESDLSPH